MSCALKVTNLNKAFGSLHAVKDLFLEVPAGAIYGFLGPNGAGKSTTIRLMLALISPDDGEIEIFGRSVTANRSQALKPVGAFIEDPDFYGNLSARTNLEILGRLRGKDGGRWIDEVLEIVELSDRADDRVRAYSRGMRQRLGIAQALLSKPKLLILDEPSSGLDPAGIKTIRKLILRLAEEEQMTVFLSSHILHEVELMCTDLAVVNHGQLIKTGPVSELLYQSGAVITEFQVSEVRKAEKLLLAEQPIRKVWVEQDILKVSVDRNELARLIKLLVDNDVSVNAVVPRTSLEDYFLSLTGGGVE